MQGLHTGNHTKQDEEKIRRKADEVLKEENGLGDIQVSIKEIFLTMRTKVKELVHTIIRFFSRVVQSLEVFLEILSPRLNPWRHHI